MASNTLWQQSEAFRKKAFPLWMEADYGVLSDFISKGEVEQVGERDYKIPFELTPGGIFGHWDPQMGDMGPGSSPTGDFLTQSFYTMSLNYQFDMMQIKATEKPIGVKNPFTQCIANGYRELQMLWDKTIHGTGTAQLAQAQAHSSGTGVSVYTMTNAFGTQLLRIGQFYTIYDSTLATIKSNAVLWVTQINTQARTVTLSGIVPNAAATDAFCFKGVSGPSPVGPRGLKYWNNPATTGFTAGINRANQNQIVAKSVDGSNGFNTDVILALHDRIFMDRGEVPNMIGIVAPAQRAYAYAQMQAIQQVLVEGSSVKAFDRLPKLKGKEVFDWGGVTHYVDIAQDQTTAAYIVPSDWGRARLGNEGPGFFQIPGKSGYDSRFFNLVGASGAPAAGVWFSIVQCDDLYCLNPGQSGVVTNLPPGNLYGG